MAIVQPLELETIFINILSEDLKMFTIVAFITIVAVSAYFRMSLLAMFFMFGLFLVMFTDYVDQSLIFMLISFMAVFVGVVIARIVNR